jgi:LacI family transcriptional regulator
VKKVLIAFEFYRRPLLEGVFQYAKEMQWHLSLEMVNRPSDIPWGWQGDGVLAMLIHGDSDLLHFLKTLSLPTINLEGRAEYPYPRVRSDSVAGAKMVIDDMQQKGYRHFAFYGPKDSTRGRDFLLELEFRGLNGHHIMEEQVPWGEQLDICARELTHLVGAENPPLAVYSWTDYSAANFINMAQSLGYDIPKDIMVMGTDDEELVCESSAVRLSSLFTDLHGVGYLGAKQLDAIMSQNKSVGDMTHPPAFIKERMSTSGLAIQSERLRQVVDAMKARFSQGINVSDVVKLSGMSRRSLEHLFRAELGSTPRQILENIRLQHAKNCLLDSQDKIASISAACGYSDPHNFSKVFKQHTGLSPKRFRETAKI